MIRKLLIVLIIVETLNAQFWSGIVDSGRAVDWSQVGATITHRTTQCGSEIAAYSGSAATINTAITNCTSGQYVQLGAGTFSLSSGITFGSKSNVTLRGYGADQTKLIFSAGSSCRGFTSAICIGTSSNPSMPSPSTTTTWTGGYTKGTTDITVGSSSGMSAGRILILDQLNDASDGGGIYVCDEQNVCVDEGGGGHSRADRGQQQLVTVVAVNGTTVTVAPGLYMPNWRTDQTPGISWSNVAPLTGDGVEDLSLDIEGFGGSSGSGITILYATNCWVRGIRSLFGDRNHIRLYQSIHITVRDSYFWGTYSSGSQGYGVEMFSTSDILVENNIGAGINGHYTINGGDSGSVYAYNYGIGDEYTTSPTWQINNLTHHDSGIAMILHEGNDGQGFTADAIHGTHHFVTAFRNRYDGRFSTKTSQTVPIHIYAFSRFYNLIGNVLGTSGYHTNYDCLESESCNHNVSIYAVGWSSHGTTDPQIGVNDSVAHTGLMRWGNWDTVTSSDDNGTNDSTGTRFVSGEVPASEPNFPNSVPASETLPASFYLSAKPSWFGSVPWPPIGPDVASGNISNTGGHANKIPARVCYEAAATDTDYSAGETGIPVKQFNAAACYAASSSGNPVRSGGNSRSGGNARSN